MVKVKIKKLRPNALVPDYQTPDSAAVDLHACLGSPMTIKPMERAMIPTGLSIELPSGWEFRISARSGLSIKNGISMANGIGIIDADFRDEMHVLVVNLGDQDFVVEPNMRIAQALAAPVEKIEWEESDTLSKTERKGGFGSTGTS